MSERQAKIIYYGTEGLFWLGIVVLFLTLFIVVSFVLGIIYFHTLGKVPPSTFILDVHDFWYVLFKGVIISICLLLFLASIILIETLWNWWMSCHKKSKKVLGK